MRRFMLAYAALVSTGCAGVLGLDEFTEGEASSGGGSGTGEPTATTTSQGGAGSTTTTTTSGSAGGTGEGGSGAGTGQGGDGEGGAGGSDPLGVTPDSPVKVGILHARQFSATVPVEWSIEEADGGRVDETGLYIAPETPGAYHLLATSIDDPEEQVSVTITVAPLGIKVLGGQPGGPGTLDGPPNRSRVDRVAGMAALDGGSKLMFADSEAHTLRVMDFNDDEEVTTVAGVPYVSGAINGTGTEALFNGPTDVAADRDSSVGFVVDRQNFCIRRINTSTGAVTTLAGQCGERGHLDAGTGASVFFEEIESMVMGPEGTRLYVCQIGDTQAIRVVTVSTGATITLPQTYLGQVSYGCKLGADYQQEVYLWPGGVASPYLRSFRDVAPFDTGSVLQVGPVDTSRYFTALAVDNGWNGDVLAADNRTVYRLDLNVGAPSFDAFFGSDTEEAYVDGALSEVRLHGARAMASNGGYSSFYFADEAYTIRRLDRNDDEVSTIGGKPSNVEPIDGPKAVARLVTPFALALDEEGNSYSASFGESGDNVIRRVDAATGEISTFSGVRGEVVEVVDGAADVATFGFVIDMVRVGDSLYAADLFSNTVRRISLADGSVETIAGQNGAQGFEDAIGQAALFDFEQGAGLATDGVDLYVGDANNYAIRKIELATNAVTTLAGGTEGTEDGTGALAQFLRPAGVTFDAGILYIADYEDHVIRRLDLETAEVTTLIGLTGTPGNEDGGPGEATLFSPFSMTADHLGNLFVTSLPFENDEGPALIRRVVLEDVQISGFAGSATDRGFSATPLPASLGCATGIKIDAQGDLIFADFCDGAIGAIRTL